ncbi:MAG: thioredoxin family protein [Ignavibacteria bacterium]|nr:thioredoxin family protein [Ignavibacteria bacterium]
MISIKILGSECKKCRQLEENAKAAIKIGGFEATVEKVTDFTKIISYGVVGIPALVINEKVVSIGRVLKREEIIQLIKSQTLTDE